MTLPGNGTVKRIIAGVAISIVVFLAGMVIANSTRITALEVRVESMVRTLDVNAAQLETNRKENREEHQKITDRLDGILRELKAK